MSSNDAPVFIVGMSRSGTTLLSRMLDAHSQIAILPETWMYVVLDRLGGLAQISNPWQSTLFFNEVWSNLRNYRDPAARVLAREAAIHGRYVGPTFRILEEFGRSYALERTAKIWGEKTPGHALWLPQIRTLFPLARILFMVRDPRDVLVSYDERWGAGKRNTGYLASTTALLKYYLNYLLYSRAFPAEQVRWVRYESLVANPAAELEATCAFLGVDFEVSMLAFHEQPDMADAKHHALLSRPATTEKIGQYRQALSAAHIALVERLLGDEMKALGYPLSESHAVSIHGDESKSLRRAQQYYRRMAAGEIRKRFRRSGSVKLRAYQFFGRALGIVQSWRVVNSAKDWQVLADGDGIALGAQQRSDATTNTGPTADRVRASFKTEMGRISRQSGIAFAGTIFTAVVGYGFKIYLARILGADALGLYALGITIISFLGMANTLGIPQSAIRFVAEYSASKKILELRALLWNGGWILLGINLIFAGVLLKVGPWISIRFYHAPQLVRYLPWFAVIMLLSPLNLFCGNVMTGYREAGRRTIISKFVSSPATIAATVLLVTLGYGLEGYLAAQVFSACCVLALLTYWVWRLTPSEARSPNLSRLGIGREVWSFSAAMVGLGMMQFLTVQTDRVALGVYRGPHDVGIYAVVVSMIAYETIFLQSVNQIFAPVIADIHARGEREVLGRLFQTLTKWILGLTLPLAIVVICYAPAIMRMFGHEFEAGWPALVIGTLGQLVNCGVGSVGALLVMSGHERRVVRVQVLMALVMVVLSFKLVPLWGALGAAVAAAITNAGTNLLNLIEVRRALKLSPYNWSYVKLLAPVGSAALIIVILSRSSFLANIQLASAVLALILAYSAFCAVSLWTGLDSDDRLITDAVVSRVLSIFLRARSAE
jgi:O-antigen/teichoic acid export membrane protein